MFSSKTVSKSYLSVIHGTLLWLKKEENPLHVWDHHVLVLSTNFIVFRRIKCISTIHTHVAVMSHHRGSDHYYNITDGDGRTRHGNSSVDTVNQS